MLLLGLLAGLCAICVQGAPVDNADAAKMYLQRYNYMGRENMETGELMTGDDFVAAIEAFQSMANLNITGKLDNATMEMMNQPRCGMPDNMGFSHKARRKRYSAMTRWGKNDLTWRINTNTPDLSNPDTNRIMRGALEIWSDVSQLTFTEIAVGDADIIIDFNTGDHGDGSPFDGPGTVLAHAYFPKAGSSIAGDAHFDDAEQFTQNTANGINLFQVAAHEFGHSLGLGHSDDPNALMYAYYRGYIPNFQLPQDDINGIRYLYGDDTGDSTMRPFNPTTCPGQVDTFVTTNDNRTFAFIGNLVYQIEPTGVVDGFPKPIRDVFQGLPDNLDAGLCYPGNGKTYFFKGNQYWRFDGTTADPGNPRPISDWGLPSDIDAAFVWSGNNRVYFIKGDQYYRYNTHRGRIDKGYPRPLSVWQLPVPRVDAAMQWLNRRTYFFAGDSYYRFNDRKFEVSRSYPRPTAFWWFGCGDSNHGNIEQDTDDGKNGATLSVPSTVAILVSAVLGLFHLL